MPTEVTSTVVGAAEAVGEAVVAPAVASGTLNWKKVAFVAGGILVVAGSAYACKKIIDKRKAAKIVEVNPAPEVVEEIAEVVEEIKEEAPKTKAKAKK